MDCFVVVACLLLFTSASCKELEISTHRSVNNTNNQTSEESKSIDLESPSRLMNLDPDIILNDPDLVKKYFECLMDRRPCTSSGEHIKRLLPEAIATDCSRCNEDHKIAVHKVVRFLVEKRPALWRQLERKYSKYRRH